MNLTHTDYPHFIALNAVSSEMRATAASTYGSSDVLSFHPWVTSKNPMCALGDVDEADIDLNDPPYTIHNGKLSLNILKSWGA